MDPSPTSYGGSPPTDGRTHDEPRPRTGVTEEQLVQFDRDKPRPFSLDEFYNHIFYLQAARVKSGILEQVTATDFSKYFRSILDKISVLRRDPRICFFNGGMDKYKSLTWENN